MKGRLAQSLLAAVFGLGCLAAIGCGNGDDDASAPTPTASPTATPSPSASPTADPNAIELRGRLVAINRYADGHPRQIGIAVEPTEETFWTIDDEEWIYFWDSPLARQLVGDLGREIRVTGVLETGFDDQRTIFLRSYDLDGEEIFASSLEQSAPSTAVEGVITVVDRHPDGHPRRLGVRDDDGTITTLQESNKAHELRYWIGRRLRVRGRVSSDEQMVVNDYEFLEGNPLVQVGDGFRLSFLAGGLDADGNFMGGVEVDTIEAFDGRIFAGVSYRRNTDRDSPDPPPPGAQVLVLDHADGRWRVDYTVPAEEAGPAPRIVSLKRVTFTTDADAQPLAPPVEMLAAVSGNGDIYLRDAGEPGDWVATGLPEVVRANTTALERRPDARSVISHVDSVTGVSYLFVGAAMSGRRGDGAGIYRGAYDPTLPSLIRWGTEPEFPYTATREQPWRVMGLATHDGAVYASVGTLLIRRRDGAAPEWEEVYRDSMPGALDSLREATSIRTPDGQQALLVGIEGANNRVMRIDSAGLAVEELRPVRDVDVAVYGIVAYNGPGVHTLADGHPIALLGLELLRPRGVLPPDADPDLGRIYEWTDGLLLVRRPDGDYGVTRIFDTTLVVQPPLVGPRAVLGHSPFAGEENVAYVAGFDHNGHPFHNTAWIFKVRIEDLMKATATTEGPG